MENNQQLISLLLNGEVCIIPTDTVYGLVAKLNSPTAIENIYQLKHRDPEKPVGTILVASISQAATLTNSTQLQAAASYWPGPTSVVLPADDKYSYAHKGVGSLAIRIPNDQSLRALLVQTGPLASSSANTQDQPPATTVDEAKSYFKDLIPLYIDGGDLSSRLPSQIIRLEGGDTTTIRP